jgi:hypothetical protein
MTGSSRNFWGFKNARNLMNNFQGATVREDVKKESGESVIYLV